MVLTWGVLEPAAIFAVQPLHGLMYQLHRGVRLAAHAHSELCCARELTTWAADELQWMEFIASQRGLLYQCARELRAPVDFLEDSFSATCVDCGRGCSTPRMKDVRDVWTDEDCIKAMELCWLKVIDTVVQVQDDSNECQTKPTWYNASKASKKDNLIVSRSGETLAYKYKEWNEF